MPLTVQLTSRADVLSPFVLSNQHTHNDDALYSAPALRRGSRRQQTPDYLNDVFRILHARSRGDGPHQMKDI